jgi:nanoRNase/pAp phosphatase (c-di-AMP/oligoRNAs hydrolase)
MSRNVFENTTPDDEEMQALAREIGAELYSVLPTLPEGQKYELDVLGERVVLVTKKA